MYIQLLKNFREALQILNDKTRSASVGHKIWEILHAHTFFFIFTGYFNTLLQADFSSVSSPYRAAEEQRYIFFWDFLDECEGNVIYN